MKQIEKLYSAVPSLKDFSNEIEKTKGNYVLSFLDEHSRAFVLVKVATQENLEAAFKKLKELKKIQSPVKAIRF